MEDACATQQKEGAKPPVMRHQWIRGTIDGSQVGRLDAREGPGAVLIVDGGVRVRGRWEFLLRFPPPSLSGARAKYSCGRSTLVRYDMEAFRRPFRSAPRSARGDRVACSLAGG